MPRKYYFRMFFCSLVHFDLNEFALEIEERISFGFPATFQPEMDCSECPPPHAPTRAHAQARQIKLFGPPNFLETKTRQMYFWSKASLIK